VASVLFDIAGQPLLANRNTNYSSVYLKIAADFGAVILVNRPENLAADSVTKPGAIELVVKLLDKVFMGCIYLARLPRIG